MKTWSDRVKDKLTELDLKDSQVAQQIGCTKGAFSMWLSGKRTPNYKHRRAIADILDVTLEWLDTGVDAQDPSSLPFISMEEVDSYFDDLDEKSRIAHRDSGIRLVESDGRSCLVTMNNDSMLDPDDGEKTGIPVGSTIQIDQDREPKSGSIILIEHDGELKLRIWQPMGKKHHQLKVINPNYHNSLNIDHRDELKKILKGTAVAVRFLLPY